MRKAQTSYFLCQLIPPRPEFSATMSEEELEIMRAAKENVRAA